MERSVAYSLVRRRDFKDPDGNEKEIDAETLSCARNQRCYHGKISSLFIGEKT